MPILERQVDLYPAELLDQACVGERQDRVWWTFYLRARREKQFMRRLQSLHIPFYGPTILQKTRSPSGRTRESYLPLFSGYVFVYGDDEARRNALTTECVSRWLPVSDGAELTSDLRQIHRLIQSGAPVTVESQLDAGDRVRVRSGTFKGLEGVVINRHGQARLLVAVRFLQQGASLLLDDFEVERI